MRPLSSIWMRQHCWRPPEHISWATWLYTREREVYIYESWLRHALSYFSLCPRKPTDYTVGSGRIRHAASARKTPGTFFPFFFAGSHTHREKLSSSRMYVIYREKKNKTDSSAPSVSLIVNLARSWIFFFNFVQIQNVFSRKCIFKKNLVESIQERKKMAYRCIRENLFRPWITSYMMDVIQLTSLRNMNSIFFFSRPTCKVMSLKSFFFGKSFKLIISREMTHFLVCCGYVGGPRASQPPLRYIPPLL